MFPGNEDIQTGTATTVPITKKKKTKAKQIQWMINNKRFLMDKRKECLKTYFYSKNEKLCGNIVSALLEPGEDEKKIDTDNEMMADAEHSETSRFRLDHTADSYSLPVSKIKERKGFERIEMSILEKECFHM
eukprot:UN31110